MADGRGRRGDDAATAQERARLRHAATENRRSAAARPHLLSIRLADLTGFLGSR
jgi:hypothetical protein